ncbi:hypothetical protein H6G76_03525 [Nostoc sp. FACHB-152]|uniref:hypothetical protein n=1 Tax=unclassified Nostoc TaxID=2593658 RepID=UPI0016872431|nr:MULTISPECIES: hypothetical protein [unclassified Nostoc]MBD2446242.1 hypothetical protein [Nostoc sp. FACHB-152]MBD2469512.1 hypothetical protein [Nostoc sp. FACHB-145]
MSYYDFDEHFWSPKTVCIQCNQHSSQKKTPDRLILTIASILSIAIISGLTVKILTARENSNSNEGLAKNNDSISNCLLLKGDAKMQFYCSQPK